MSKSIVQHQVGDLVTYRYKTYDDWILITEIDDTYHDGVSKFNDIINSYDKQLYPLVLITDIFRGISHHTQT